MNTKTLKSNEVKHTPVPWKAEFSGFLRLTDIMGADGVRVCRIQNYNSDFILRAVNSHEELLEACKEYRNTMLDHVIFKTNNDRDRAIDADIKLYAAIAKAEGK